MRTNLKMKELLDALDSSCPPSLPAALLALISDGFVTQEGCSFLRGLYMLKGNASPSMFPDETGYECFVNHVHIDHGSAAEPLPLAMVFADGIGRAWLSSGSMESLRAIVSCNDTSTRPPESTKPQTENLAQFPKIRDL